MKERGREKEKEKKEEEEEERNGLGEGGGGERRRQDRKAGTKGCRKSSIPQSPGKGTRAYIPSPRL